VPRGIALHRQRAQNIDSVFRINVEGLLTATGIPTTLNRWVSGSRTVTVSDGRLTISNGSGASNNKICFIDIVREARQRLAGFRAPAA